MPPVKTLLDRVLLLIASFLLLETLRYLALLMWMLTSQPALSLTPSPCSAPPRAMSSSGTAITVGLPIAPAD